MMYLLTLLVVPLLVAIFRFFRQKLEDPRKPRQAPTPPPQPHPPFGLEQEEGVVQEEEGTQEVETQPEEVEEGGFPSSVLCNRVVASPQRDQAIDGYALRLQTQSSAMMLRAAIQQQLQQPHIHIHFTPPGPSPLTTPTHHQQHHLNVQQQVDGVTQDPPFGGTTLQPHILLE